MTKAASRAEQAEAELAAAKSLAREDTSVLIQQTGDPQVNVIQEETALGPEETRIRAENILRRADQVSRDRTSSVSSFEMSVSSSSINLPDYDAMFTPQPIGQAVTAMVVDKEQEGNAASSSTKSDVSTRHQTTKAVAQSIGVVVSDDEEDQPPHRRTAKANIFGNSGMRRRGRVRSVGSTVATQMEEVAIRASKQQ